MAPFVGTDACATRAVSKGGVKGDVGKAPWLVHAAGVQAQVRNQVLLLPPEKGPKKKRQRTTVDVAGRLITKELLLRGDLI